jgi:molybdate transport system substrate-binding protein
VAANIKVLGTHAVMAVMSDLAPAFERQSGHTLAVSYDPSALLRQRIESGEDFDVAVMTRAALDELAVQGRIISSCVDIGRSGLGLSVAKGSRKPDIGTVDGFKRALLAAKSVVRSRDGASGAYFATLIERLGIADAMRDKTVLGGSGRVAELVARGEAEMAVQQISELLPVAGAQYAGPFPDELQLYTVFSASVAASSARGNAAKAFIASLVAPEAAALFKTNGLEPPPLARDAEATP